ncbi:hypothetical protein GE09DRAFT_1076381 [Coniochaeta sp. 2T2.1]|nr:hypothetical protein GE09DRAFT_1076381 [Coniochaeta sp. 2T2.1]
MDCGGSVCRHGSLTWKKGNYLTEYKDPVKNPDRKYPAAEFISKYIEAKDGAEYSVICTATPQNLWLAQGDPAAAKDSALAVVFSVQIDGVDQASTYVVNTHQTARIEGVKGQAPGDSQQTMRKFKFNADLKRAPFLGTIRVQVWHGVYKGPSATVPTVRDTATLSIAEKALKGTAVSHGTTFGDTVPTDPVVFADVSYPTNSPVAIFQFRYRSKARLIVPRSPTPEPFDSFVDSELPAKDGKENQERGGDGSHDTKAVVKRERQADEMDDDDEIIDLTGDDNDCELRPVKKRCMRTKQKDYDPFEDSDPFAD